MDKALLFVVFVLLVVGTSHAKLSSEMYWKKVLPNTPMPSAIQNLLHPADLGDEKATAGVKVSPGGATTVNAGGGTHVAVGSGGHGVNVKTNPNGKPVNVNVSPNWNSFNYMYAATDDQAHDDPNAALFFLKKDMKAGNKMSVRFGKTGGGATTFLPRQSAKAIPFSSDKMSEVLDRFSVEPESEDAKLMKKTVKECEAPAAEGESRYCATSLESMVDYTTSTLGTRSITAVSTAVPDSNPSKQQYTIAASGATRLNKDNAKVVACHYQPYIYVVFYCHDAAKTEAYVVPMVGEDGTKVDAVAVCHTDTSKWNPKHLAFKVLKVKPGAAPVCHFLPQDHVVWINKN